MGMIKRVFGVCLMMLVLGYAPLVMGVESITESMTIKQNRAVITFSITSAADGTVTENSIDTSSMNYLINNAFYLVGVEYYYGATGATDDSDIYLENSEDLDVLGGAGVNQADNATDHKFHPLINGAVAAVEVIDTWSIDVRNNAVNTAIMTIKLIFEK